MAKQPGPSSSAFRSKLLVAPVLLFALTIITMQSAQAQTFNILYAFTGGPAGFDPSGVIFDPAGNLYGTYEVNPQFTGGVYELMRRNSSWVLEQLYVFPGSYVGGSPEGGQIFGPDGALYGTTFYGGPWCDESEYDCGTVYSLRPSSGPCGSASCSWSETALYVFGEQISVDEDGFHPRNGVIFDSAGNIYGTTFLGGIYNSGTAFQLSRTQNGWDEKDLYDYTRDVGSPTSGLALDAAGNLYGTSSQGEYDLGSVYELVHTTQGWNEQTIYSFQGGSGGSNPEAGLIFDAAGNAYGTTEGNSGDGQPGTVYQLSPQADGTWRETLLYLFPSNINGPISTLAMDTAGNLYGTTPGTPGNNPDKWGMVFELSLVNGSWVFTQLHHFTNGDDGATPSGVILDSAVNLYGTSGGGPYLGPDLGDHAVTATSRLFCNCCYIAIS